MSVQAAAQAACDDALASQGRRDAVKKDVPFVCSQDYASPLGLRAFLTSNDGQFLGKTSEIPSFRERECRAFKVDRPTFACRLSAVPVTTVGTAPTAAQASAASSH